MISAIQNVPPITVDVDTVEQTSRYAAHLSAAVTFLSPKIGGYGALLALTTYALSKAWKGDIARLEERHKEEMALALAEQKGESAAQMGEAFKQELAETLEQREREIEAKKSSETLTAGVAKIIIGAGIGMNLPQVGAPIIVMGFYDVVKGYFSAPATKVKQD